VRAKSALGEGIAMYGRKTSNTDEAGKGIKPLAVPVKTACQLVGVGNTSMWALIKAGKVRTVSVGRRRLVIYASLEALLSNGG
jgi:excisionase family DNA binding protein